MKKKIYNKLATKLIFLVAFALLISTIVLVVYLLFLRIYEI